MNVIAVQMNIAWHDKEANHRKVRQLLERTHVPAGSLIVLPEMFATGFSMDVAEISDSKSQQTETFLRQLAGELKSYILAGVVTLSEVTGRGLNESILVFPDGKPTVRYQKLHPFTLGGESENFTAGKQLTLIPLMGFQIAPFVCYDLRFPEIFRAAGLRGANVITVIASWPITREQHWTTLLKARAIENQCYVIGVNRSGKDPKFTYGGRTQIIGPKGGIIADAGASEGIITASLSLEAMQEYRKELPFLADIRRQYLGELAS